MATLTDVIDRLRNEGQLTRNTGTNSIKSVRIELSAQTGALQAMLKIMQDQEARYLLGLAGQDPGNSGSGGNGGGGSGGGGGGGGGGGPGDTGRTSVLAGGLAGGLAGLFGPALLALRNAIQPLLSPIRSLARLLRVWGPVAIAIGLLWEVFKDIGENENFLNALETVKEVWNEKILPTFNRLREIFDDFMASESTTNVIENLIELYDRIIISLQNFVSNTIRIIAESVGRMMDGINSILDGDYIDGIIQIVSGLFSGITGMMDNFITEFLRILGIDFGENGTFVGWITAKTQELWDWVTGIFGNMSDMVSGQWNSVTGGVANIGNWIWDKIRPVWDWMNALFSDPIGTLQSSWGVITDGVANLGSWLWEKIQVAWGWITEIFGDPMTLIQSSWNALTGGVANLGSWLWGEVSGVWDWISNMFGDLLGMFPSIDELRQALLNRMPDWMRRLVGAPERTTQEIIDSQINTDSVVSNGQSAAEQRNAEARRQIASLQEERQALIDSALGSGIDPDTSYYDTHIARFEEFIRQNSFQNGTRGFMDFGSGSLAMLHGIEAVVPRDTPAGQFIANNFDENFNPIMRRIASVETAAMQQAQSPTIVVNAPTVAPVRQTVGGSTTVNTQRVTSYGTGSTSVGLGGFAQ